MARAGYETARLRLARFRAEGAQARQLGAKNALQISAVALGVERVGVWMFDSRATRIECVQLFELSTRSFRAAPPLQAREFPRYFAALRERRAIAADQAQSDPITAELTGSYLVPNGITSMLDAPIIREGNVVGVVCHEHVGEPRVWMQKDIDFASTVADMLALVLEQADRLTLEASLGAHAEEALESQKTEALQRMARAVAHDINNVLTSLSLASAQISEHPDPKVENAARDIVESSRTISRLSRQLVELGKQRGAGATETDLIRSLEGQKATLGALLAGRGELLVEPRMGAAVVRMEPNELEQIFLNLCANARDALGDGGEVRIVVREPTSEDWVSHDQLVVEVVDNGAGMDEETRTHVLEPYFTTKANGTGLGLALVQSSILRAGGTLQIESERGRGTRVVFSLPRAA
ncbi:MAG: GAF domain-containing sensor histidine kinase [Polyangiaceae bacterium]